MCDSLEDQVGNLEVLNQSGEELSLFIYEDNQITLEKCIETSEDPWGGIRRDSGAGGLLYKDSNETNGRFCCAQHDTAQHRRY
mgnify:CR=1 FL=1